MYYIDVKGNDVGICCGTLSSLIGYLTFNNVHLNPNDGTAKPTSYDELRPILGSGMDELHFYRTGSSVWDFKVYYKRPNKKV